MDLPNEYNVFILFLSRFFFGFVAKGLQRVRDGDGDSTQNILTLN